jgi:acetolactate synthase I/II/III large subunit
MLFPAAERWEEDAMKELIRQYIDQGISRRKLMTGLSAVGLSTVVAKSIAQSLAPVAGVPPASSPAGATRQFKGTGGALFVQQLKAAGVEYIFFNPSTGDSPIYDALVDEPGIHLIKGVQEGTVVAMADGYARASGKTGVVIVPNIGLPNAMTQMVNTFKDRIPLLVVVAAFGQDQLGRDGPQDYEHQEVMVQPITKWYWQAGSAAGIPETTRRALKFASTAPAGPVFLAIPDNLLRMEATAAIMDQALFDVPMLLRPDAKDVETVARMLIEAKNPMLSIGDEVTLAHGEAEVLELAELLGLPVAGQAEFGTWSKPFPTRNPLYLGTVMGTMRFPGAIDVHLNIGSPYGERAAPGKTLISIRRDPTSLARVTPVDLAIVADPKLAAADLVAAVKSIATKERLKQIADDRGGRVHSYTKGMVELRQTITRDLNDGSPIHMERLGAELEKGLAKDTIYVADVDSGKTMEPLIGFGGDDKKYIGTGPNVLGWGMAGGFGAKLAQPDKPVVAIVGDGSFLFSGPTPLWSISRYKAPITVIVLNNHSYNNERNRIWTFGAGAQFKTGRDMTCYNGSPDVDFTKTAAAYGVEGETVKEPDQIQAALQRAKAANVDGRPYFLEFHIRRDGVGAASEWHPPLSIAALRTRKV